MTRGGHILVVDDSAATRRGIVDALMSNGFEVSQAAEGLEGLCKVRATVFDLIITDIHMPTMDGLAFLRELRKLSEYAEIPVVVLTSDVSAERIQQVRQAGANAWLEKPPNLATLAELVRSSMEARTGSEN